MVEEQSGFVPRHSILDGVIIAMEAVHSVNNIKWSSMLLKLDIKVYDRVDWIFNIIVSWGYSIMVNGSFQGFCEASKGLC